MKLEVVIDGKEYEIELYLPGEAPSSKKHREPLQSAVVPAVEDLGLNGDGLGAAVCRSPLSGIVTVVYVQPGDE
ncbi:MAG TPA: hypothetical protein VGU90_02300, partial [Terriglobales bacterium]|nr:hypothetical protein [Terriglobales bacterium]